MERWESKHARRSVEGRENIDRQLSREHYPRLQIQGPDGPLESRVLTLFASDQDEVLVSSALPHHRRERFNKSQCVFAGLSHTHRKDEVAGLWRILPSPAPCRSIDRHNGPIR